MYKFQVNILLLSILTSFCIACNENSSSSEENKLVEEAEMAELPEEENVPEEALYKIPPAIDTTIHIAALGNSIEEMRYNKEEIVVPSFGKIQVILENQSEGPKMIHNIVFVAKGSMEKVAMAAVEVGMDDSFVPDIPAVFGGSELAEPGEKVELLFTAPAQSGEYLFLCTYPGHWEHMNGRLIVETVAE